MTNTNYTLLGSLTKIPQVDLENLVSAANRRGDTRKGGDSLGKFPGKRVMMVATSDSTLKEMIALGDKSSDGWRVVDGSATTTPVNLNPAAAGWTIGADSTYAANLLTTDGGNDAAGRASQAVTLKAGTYKLRVVAAAEGVLTGTPNYVAPRMRMVCATDTGANITKVFKEKAHATAAEDADPKQEYVVEFTLAAASQTVTFTIDIVDETAGDATLAAGSSYIAFDVLEAA
jgi:hypothetical protein